MEQSKENDRKYSTNSDELFLLLYMVSDMICLGVPPPLPPAGLLPGGAATLPPALPQQELQPGAQHHRPGAVLQRAGVRAEV